ncbi:uncharacterized protein LOC123510321 [Portunus trituberculatus]|uniref:uncharacterized protein LOC123510321 n=1 Tax=Portunus trituberculatus TaxID=210409 RepID=UPI001E1D09F9|nr:uncharacterized protein LOC123510321 [Portunus trituberculatus]
MENRDENGRLRLPREDFIPFQRVLHRTHRSTRKPPEDVTSSLGRLSLHRRKERSDSLPEKRANYRRNGDAVGDAAEGRGAGHSNKGNFVPFQRVLHRRRKNSLPQASPLPEPRRYRDRLDWEHQKPHALIFDPHHKQDARRRQHRPRKNDSHLNNLFENHRAEEHNGEVEDGGVESPRGIGTGHSDGGSDAASIASVKLPQIHGSPPNAPESARSGRTSELATASSSALTTRLEPLDS